MEQSSRTALVEHFSALDDSCQQAKVLYPLPEIVSPLPCATLAGAGADDVVEMRLWGKRNLVFPRRFLAYEHGVPSHDTLGEVIRVIDPDLFKACFTSWVEGLREDAPDIVAIDGMTSRRSHARGHGREPLHLVSAWASRQRLVLGQQAVAGKSNEITAIPLLLERLALTGALVTIDAIGTQSKIADIESATELAEKTLSAFGRIDVLINNAAVFSAITMAPFWELPVAEWERAARSIARAPWCPSTCSRC